MKTYSSLETSLRSAFESEYRSPKLVKISVSYSTVEIEMMTRDVMRMSNIYLELCLIFGAKDGSSVENAVLSE